MTRLVLMDHDGAIDDFLATLLLVTLSDIELLGVVVTPADCYLEPAVSVTRKILDLADRPEVPVAASTVRGINPFPRLYRRDCFIVDRLPILNERETIRTPRLDEPGAEFMARSLRNAPEPVTLMVTGPLTTVATALDLAPDIEAKIKEIVWMGGALNVSGNVEKAIEPGQDGSAEWNVYWDPIAADRVWKTEIPLILCPLDATNQVPVTTEFVDRLSRQRRYPLCDLAGQCYAITMPQDYYAWDVLATAYLGRPDLYRLQRWETQIITEGISQGRTQVVSGGRKIQAMEPLDSAGFFQYLLQQWSGS